MIKLRRHRKSVLQKCGFKRKDSGRSSEEKWVLEINGQLVALTSCPHGNREIGKGLFSKVLKQIHLDRDQYDIFSSCKWQQRHYRAILVKKRKIAAA